MSWYRGSLNPPPGLSLARATWGLTLRIELNMRPLMTRSLLALCSALVHGHVIVVPSGGRRLQPRAAAVAAFDDWENDGYRPERRQGGNDDGGGRAGGNSGGGDGIRERRAGGYGGGNRYGGGGGGYGEDYDGGGGYRERRTGGNGGGYSGGGGYGEDYGGGGGYRERRTGGYGGGYGGGGGYRGGGGGGGGGGGYRERYGGGGGAGSRERRDVRRQQQGANVKPGDWKCPACGANVFASKARCFKCNTPNPDPEARAAAAARASRGIPPWHPDAERPGGGGRAWEWQGLDGGDEFEAGLADDEAAFRAAFGPAKTSGIDFASYSEIPVETELPRGMPQLTPEASPVERFDELECGRVLRRNLRLAGFEVPTPVQAHSVPVALNGIDIIAVAQTGSGKTLAFMLPILKRLLQSGSRRGTRGYGADYRNGRGEPVAIRALVLAPTRELAQQIHTESDKFAFRTGLRVCVAYGGTPFVRRAAARTSGLTSTV